MQTRQRLLIALYRAPNVVMRRLEIPRLSRAVTHASVVETKDRDPSAGECARQQNELAVAADAVLRPAHHDHDAYGWKRHIGLYAYRVGALRAFTAMAPSPLEATEKLEQLRFLENGIPIIVKETKYDTIGVDTQADLDEVRKIFKT